MIDSLLEKYLDTIKYNLIPGISTQADVFKNPSSKEIREIINQEDNYNKAVRFIAMDSEQEVLAFVSSTLHDDVWKRLGDGRKLYSDEDLLVGVLEKNGKIKFESSYLYSPVDWNEIIQMDWSWADRYIKGLSKAIKKEKPQ